MCIIFFFCHVRIIIIGLCGRERLVPRPKPTQETTAARLAFHSFPVTSPMCTAFWAQNHVCRSHTHRSPTGLYSNGATPLSVCRTMAGISFLLLHVRSCLVRCLVRVYHARDILPHYHVKRIVPLKYSFHPR